MNGPDLADLDAFAAVSRVRSIRATCSGMTASGTAS